MSLVQSENYPFVEELLTDKKGKVRKVILNVEEYQRLIEALEDEGLYRAMQTVKNETPSSLQNALEELERNES